MNNRPQTISQRFGFQDPDLSSPNHDKMIIWLDKEMNDIVDRILKRPVRKYYETGFSSFYRIPDDRLGEYDMTGIEKYPDVDMEKIQIKKVWEYPVLNGSYTVGFCDMYVEVKASWEGKNIVFSSSSKQISEAETVYVELPLYFEVKSSIPSLGELLRQIRMYESYTQDGQWFVVSPDTRFRTVIEGQNIGFIEAPDPYYL
jgi:hypothetical protein